MLHADVSILYVRFITFRVLFAMWHMLCDAEIAYLTISTSTNW